LWLIGVECQNIALAWSTAGAKGIVLVGCNIGKLEGTVKALKVPSFVVSGNVTPESDIESIFERAVAEFGKLDVLIKLRDNEPGGDNGRG
jgi:NAD(P)-dependent dehydrogenase (short-subunit alcohol dehydrogenase family)